MIRLLVTGASGQVAHALAGLRAPDIAVVAEGRPGLDITRPDSVAEAIERERPDVVVNAAAYTAVDKAESEPDAAFAVNRDGAANVARQAALAGTPIIHISTDYVFDGTKPEPYVETDAPNPSSVYGRSKLEGEQAIRAVTPDHAILRTAWVYGPHGSNFARTMLRLAADRDEVRVVADQQGNPTHAGDIATGIMVVARAAAEDVKEWRGTFHMVSRGSTTWAGFAEEVFRASRKRGGPYATVVPITTADYPTAAPRPANSRLSTDRYQRVFTHSLPRWNESVGTVA